MFFPIASKCFWIKISLDIYANLKTAFVHQAANYFTDVVRSNYGILKWSNDLTDEFSFRLIFKNAKCDDWR